MNRRLEGRVAVVTGAGRGIGRAIAHLLAEQGAAVVVNDRGTDVSGQGDERGPADVVAGEIRAAGGRACTSYGDVSSWTSAEGIIGTALKEFGRLDILVNNAGILRDRMLFNMTEEEWDAVVAVHLKGTFNCTRHACAHMRQQRSGRIISMSSSSGLYGNSGQANYGAAKDGIAGLTRVVAREMGKYGVTMNAVAPAAATRMMAAIPDSARRAREARGVALPRSQGPQASLAAEDIAPFVVYLATDAAADINGQTFAVMGGMIAHLNDPAPLRTIERASRWTPEEIARVFPTTLGRELVNPAPAEGAAPATS
jgi:NAD(P)-dependent dehydrogenase (short-subunit alcohol dehydrogenase family)